ncbi:hypothetical protein J6G99_02795 [bacterium]|nr:hypothetical protein [bacterium]
MNNNISFTGINNVKMTMTPMHEKLGYYLTEKGNLKIGFVKFREYKLNFNIFNDKDKADYDEFVNSMAKSKKEFIKKFQEPNKIELYSKRFFINDEENPIKFSIFKINGEDIIPTRTSMNIFTKLAELTRRISKMENLSEKQQKFAKFLNYTIADEATKFIELM